MKKALVALLFLVGVTVTGVATTQSAGAAASYCKSGTYYTNYRKTYEYPTGTYWQTQIKAYPDYYKANNSYFLAKYGC